MQPVERGAAIEMLTGIAAEDGSAVMALGQIEDDRARATLAGLVMQSAGMSPIRLRTLAEALLRQRMAIAEATEMLFAILEAENPDRVAAMGAASVLEERAALVGNSGQAIPRAIRLIEQLGLHPVPKGSLALFCLGASSADEQIDYAGRDAIVAEARTGGLRLLLAALGSVANFTSS